MTGRPVTPTRRRYDNTLRRERAGRTRDRIVAAGAELLHESSIRDWRALTIRTVAERAEVNERTVFRHFATERALRDAVMQRLEQRAGIDLTQLGLDGIGDAAARLFRYTASYPMERRAELDPTLADANRRQHEALVRAVEDRTARWSSSDRMLAAAMFDVLWALSSYERLVVDWHLDREAAIRAITWVIELLQDAVSAGRCPPQAQPEAGSRS